MPLNSKVNIDFFLIICNKFLPKGCKQKNDLTFKHKGMTCHRAVGVLYKKKLISFGPWHLVLHIGKTDTTEVFDLEFVNGDGLC